MYSFKDDKILFYIRDNFGKENKSVEKYIERGDCDTLRYYINQFMATKKGKNMKSLNVELPEKEEAPFSLY
jgi:hypothetical protein